MDNDWHDASPKEDVMIATWKVLHKYKGKRQAMINSVRMVAFIAERERFTAGELAEHLGIAEGTALYMLNSGSRCLPIFPQDGQWVNLGMLCQET